MPEREKDELADALHALHEEDADDGEQLAEGFNLDSSPRPVRPLHPGQKVGEAPVRDAPEPEESEGTSPTPESIENASRFDRIVDDDMMEVPAPSEEMLAMSPKQRRDQ